jgi:hypothetical protein
MDKREREHMGNEIEPVTVQELNAARRRRKKMILRLVSSFLSVVLIPVILTVVLAAYEDETNEWVRSLFEGEKKETYMESLKRLASEGNMPEYECGSLGSTVVDVISRCGEPIARSDTYDVSSTQVYLHYVYGDNKLVSLRFENERLKEIKIVDRSKETLPVNEVKRVFGDPLAPDLKGTYEYQLSKYHLTFHYNEENGKMERILLSTKESFGYTGSPRTQLETEVHPVDQAKRISSAGGVTAAKQLHEWISQGDMGNYDCGSLGASFQEVTSGKCRAYEKNLSHKKVNQQDDERELMYTFKDREIHINFFKDVLTSISVREKANAIPVTKEDIIRVFGKPAPKKSSSLNLGGESDNVSYQINGNKVYFYFNKNKELERIWFFKDGLYDEEFGFLLPQKK